jgi:biotin synthase-like enzyme
MLYTTPLTCYYCVQVRGVNGMGMEVCCTLGMINPEQVRTLQTAAQRFFTTVVHNGRSVRSNHQHCSVSRSSCISSCISSCRTASC